MSITVSSLLACSICFGSDGATLDGANAAVIFMLLILVGVLGSFLSFIFYLARRSRRLALEDELSGSFSASTEVGSDKNSGLTH